MIDGATQTYSVWHYVIFVLPALLAVYLLPTIISLCRDSTKKGAVICVNILLGWTFVGWAISLVMALSYERKSDYELKMAALSKIANNS
ncbi:MAG: superinfection immunity protein [Acetobacter indonesiensis]|jgi:TM2 domain-containing membrane protein YozV|nr:superinfection immunity protein [Acetobacter indonesiensis]MCI1546179.1 superinfection immunity protein [Acetobacter indonesiensis]MCI1765624.1 superinfection immunity protein [Acetobacter indonesiensis]